MEGTAKGEFSFFHTERKVQILTQKILGYFQILTNHERKGNMALLI